MEKKHKLLLVTDFYYNAKGREYYKEDLELSRYLHNHFTVVIAHIDNALAFQDHVDLLLLRNTGPQMLHKRQLAALKNSCSKPMFNDLLGKGDLAGKRHLLDLYQAGYSVIPTFSSKKDAAGYDRYFLKPLNGADSSGTFSARYDELEEHYLDKVVQPLIHFEYEVSFYFIGTTFHYALYTPDPECRWKLAPYTASDEDIAFAKTFVEWNSCKVGMQRVDACRTQDGRLLLMELEDYNPFLSLDLLEPAVKGQFLEALCQELRKITA